MKRKKQTNRTIAECRFDFDREMMKKKLTHNDIDQIEAHLCEDNQNVDFDVYMTTGDCLTSRFAFPDAIDPNKFDRHKAVEELTMIFRLSGPH